MAVRAAFKGLMWLMAAALGLAALGCAALFVQAARLPYNDQGHYFDGVVVHQAQAVGVYGGLALVIALLALALGCLARRLK